MPTLVNRFNISIPIILSVFLLVLLTGCATTKKVNAVKLAPSLSYTLSPPPVTHISKTESHLVEIAFNNQHKRFIAQIEYGQNTIAMAAVSVEGIALFDFVWSLDGQVETNKYLPLPNIDIQNIIADIQLCHWPITQIVSSLAGKNVEITQQDDTQEPSILWRRTIKQDNQIIVKIDKTENGYQLAHTLRNYHIKLTKISQEDI